MKKGKRVKVVFPIEYRLLVTPVYKEREKQTVTLFGLRTINEFTNFHYEIIVEPAIADKTIRLNIRGLRAPQVTIPGSGPAVFRQEFPDLHGTYALIVRKLDKQENAFTISITNERITVKESEEHRFIDVVTNPEEW
jgi:hypothetical protein